MRRAVKRAKLQYRDKLEADISSTNSRQLWQGINKISGYKPKSKSAPTDDASLPDKLNEFYARFDRPVPKSTASSTQPSEPPFQLPEHDTRCGLAKLNVKKAAGPDGITPGLLRSCADELCGILCTIYNWSLRTCHVPQIFKKSIVILVPKRTPVTRLNDYRPVAITSIAMKVLE